MQTENVIRLLKIAGKYDDIIWQLSWNENLLFFFNVNDVFCYAADSIEVLDEDLDLLEESLSKCIDPYVGIVLFAAKKQKILPLNRFFEKISEQDKIQFQNII